LSRCRQKELLALKLQSPQAHAAQSDLILEFSEQGFNFLFLSLCLGELGRIHQLPCALSRRFVLVDNKGTEGSTGALWS